jgi:hypothetical protein
MTAATAYEVPAIHDSVESSVQEKEQDYIVLGNVSVKQEKERPKESLYKRIDAAVLDLSILNGSLGAIGGFMQDASVKCDSCGVGVIIEQYTEQINDCVGHIQEFLSADMRESNV